MTLADDLLAAQTQLTKDQASLDQATARQNAAEFELAASKAATDQLRQTVANDLAEVARIQKEIDAQVPPAGKGPIRCMWCQSNGDWTQWTRLQSKLGIPPAELGFRSTGGEGEMDNDFIIKGTKSALAAGVGWVSLQVQPKVGSGGSRKGIPYKDITAGKYDPHIIAGFQQYKVLPPGKKMPFEPHSEYDVQNGIIGPQPIVGPAEDYAPFVIHLDQLARAEGVRDRLYFICSASGGTWNTEWKKWCTKALMDSGAVDGFGQDFYAKLKNKLHPVADATRDVIAAARSYGVTWSVPETGCVENPGHPFDKPRWYDSWIPVLDKDGHDCYMVCFNTTLKPYSVESTPESWAAFNRLMHDPVWRKS